MPPAAFMIHSTLAEGPGFVVHIATKLDEELIFFFFKNPAPTDFSPLPLHAALPIFLGGLAQRWCPAPTRGARVAAWWHTRRWRGAGGGWAWPPVGKIRGGRWGGQFCAELGGERV